MKYDMPKISIIIPVYNVEKYLKECIESILNQSSVDFEIILVDDGSTDRSSSICDEYAEQYNKIKVFHKKNSGQAGARNLGIAKSVGEYIMFIDSDDYLYSQDAIKSIIEEIIKGPDIIIYGLMRNSHMNKIANSRINRFLHMPYNVSTGEDYLLYMLKTDKYYPWGPCCYAIKKRFWEDKGFSFTEDVFYEDLRLVWKVVAEANSISVIRKILYMYRVDQEMSTTKVYSFKIISDHLDALKNNVYELSKSNYSDNLKRMIMETFASDYFVLLLRIFTNSNEKNDILKKKSEKIYCLFKDYVVEEKYRIIIFWITILGFRRGMECFGKVKLLKNHIFQGR